MITYSGSDKWKQKVTELLNESSSSSVKDVLVDGESVVDKNHIANLTDASLVIEDGLLCQRYEMEEE